MEMSERVIALASDLSWLNSMLLFFETSPAQFAVNRSSAMNTYPFL